MVPIALRLLTFADSAEGATAFLKRVLNTNLGHGDLGDIYAALANAGDNEAPAKLEALAYQDPRRGAGSLVSAIRALAKTSREEAFAAAERYYRRTRSDAAAYLVLEIDADRGMRLVLDLYQDASVAAQADAGRVLRWLAPRAALVKALSDRAASGDAGQRWVAADIAGWLPFEEPASFLDGLVDDEDQQVERAALAALRRRQADRDCALLLADLPAQPRPRQWAWLHAIIRRADPDILAHGADPRGLQKVVNPLGDEFRAEANQALKKRMREVDRETENTERRRRA